MPFLFFLNYVSLKAFSYFRFSLALTIISTNVSASLAIITMDRARFAFSGFKNIGVYKSKSL